MPRRWRTPSRIVTWSGMTNGSSFKREVGGSCLRWQPATVFPHVDERGPMLHWKYRVGVVGVLAVVANLPWIVLALLDAPVSDDNRTLLYGTMVLAAAVSSVLVLARAVVRRLRDRRPWPPRVWLPSVAVGFSAVALFGLASTDLTRGEVAASVQNFLVAAGAALWWMGTRRRHGRARSDNRGAVPADALEAARSRPEGSDR